MKLDFLNICKTIKKL